MILKRTSSDNYITRWLIKACKQSRDNIHIRQCASTVARILEEINLILLLASYGSEENLRAALASMQVTGRSVDDIMEKVRNRHYQVYYK
jgi:hypothetical protein